MEEQGPFARLAEVLDLWLEVEKESRGRTAVQIASAAGITESMLSSYRNKRSEISIATLGKILVALGKSLTDLDLALLQVSGGGEEASEVNAFMQRVDPSGEIRRLVDLQLDKRLRQRG